MKIKKGSMLDKARLSLIKHFKYKMSQRDKELLIESIIIVVIYLLSFGILSMGRVPESFWGMSETTFANIQMFMLTFAFAIIITLIVYSMYKQAMRK